MKEEGWIQVTGARVHNLKNVDVQIPRGKLTVFTGLSGSGKSSLAFDTIFAEGQRRYIDTFSAYARGYLNNMRRPEVDKITGLSPVISIDQKTTSHNPRSTVGTITEVYDYLRLLFARAGIAYSYNTGEEMVHYTDEQITDIILHDYAGERIYFSAAAAWRPTAWPARRPTGRCCPGTPAICCIGSVRGRPTDSSPAAMAAALRR